MESQEFIQVLLKNKMVEEIYLYVRELCAKQIDEECSYKEDVLIILSVYFSLLSEGNTCISLNKDILLKKWNERLAASKILLEGLDKLDEEEFALMAEASSEAINNSLELINEQNLPSLIGKNKMMLIDDGYLYFQKYELARVNIISCLDKLFAKTDNLTSSFNYKDCVNENFKLSAGQEKIINDGINKNLVITGGPGTGKTTSILFLLLNILSVNKNHTIYLVAPSGKASSRMKESIINGLSNLTDDYKNNHADIINIISSLQEYTIHRLLSFDYNNQGFFYNKTHQFASDSIFIVDESSMIDECIFDSLLSAVNPDSRLFLLGDKNQLPSVESGSVFADILVKPSLQNHIIALDESIRFSASTKIYALASSINQGTALPVKESDWKDLKDFALEEIKDDKPIFYYEAKNKETEKDDINNMLDIWGNKFIGHLQKSASDLDESDQDKFKSLFDSIDEAMILCAEKEGIRGVKAVNNYLKRKFIDHTLLTSVDWFYTGEIIMITKNNKMLDLYNGDIGILVTFKDDNTLYYMVKKSSSIVQKDGKDRDKIFKLGDFIFYPFRMISAEEIDLAYAITIHKSQGSDYKNILVILPSQKGHPLINRQIVYTAITRTKGNTYILSNQERLEEARDTVIVRDTNIN